MAEELSLLLRHILIYGWCPVVVLVGVQGVQNGGPRF